MRHPVCPESAPPFFGLPQMGVRVCVAKGAFYLSPPPGFLRSNWPSLSLSLFKGKETDRTKGCVYCARAYMYRWNESGAFGKRNREEAQKANQFCKQCGGYGPDWIWVEWGILGSEPQESWLNAHIARSWCFGGARRTSVRWRPCFSASCLPAWFQISARSGIDIEFICVCASCFEKVRLLLTFVATVTTIWKLYKNMIQDTLQCCVFLSIAPWDIVPLCMLLLHLIFFSQGIKCYRCSRMHGGGSKGVRVIHSLSKKVRAFYFASLFSPCIHFGFPK